MNNKTVFASNNETEILKFRVARSNVEILEEKKLQNEIIQDSYDFCRLKLSAEDENISLKLYSIGFPFYFSGSIRRYKTKISENDRSIINHNTLTFEEYDGSQLNLLKEMLRGTWGDYPLGYYRTPLLTYLVDKEIELESVFNFYRHNNLKSNNTNNTIMFMKDQGNYVGFFALNKVNDTLESHIGGILQDYRKDGYFLDMLAYIKSYCLDNNLSHFAFGARNENAEVQRIFQYVGFQPIGTENVFHILPFLTYSQKQVITNELKIQTSLITFVEETICQYYKNSAIQQIQILELEKIENYIYYQIELLTPIIGEKESFVVVKIKKNEQIISLIYTTLAHL